MDLQHEPRRWLSTHRPRHLRAVFFLLVPAVLLLGCRSFLDADQSHVTQPSALVTPDQSVGQTFVARHGGLTGIEFWLEPASEVRGTLRLHLRAEPGAEGDLATATVPLDEVTAPGFVRFSFRPQRDSHGRYYYALLSLEGEGAVGVGRAPGGAYLDGALYQRNQPQDAQAAFRLAYAPLWSLVDLLKAAGQGAGQIGATLLLYVVPGWAILAWFWPESKLAWPERLALAAGISLSLYPLLLVWTDVVGAHLGALNAWLPVLVASGALAWRHRSWRPQRGIAALRRWPQSATFWPDVAFLAVLALIFGTRLLIVRTLDAPMWGDSVQHATIAQLLVDNGGIFESWEPYAPYQSLTVHTGFHAIVAIYAWFTGTTGISATLWAAQLLNGLATLTLYPLAVRVARGQRWAGAGAVLAAGLLSPMPGYYVNWGRYAQLAGQAILPVTLWLLWATTEDGRARRPALLLGGVTLAGMTLSYYRMPFYLVAFAVPWFLLWSWSHWRSSVGWGHYSQAILSIVVLGLVGILLFLPWAGALAGSSLSESMERGMNAPPAWAGIVAEYQVWKDILWYVPLSLLASAVGALLWSLLLGQWEPGSIALWIVVLSGLVAARLINLPGANFMQNFSVIIALYIPVGVLVGWGLGRLDQVLSRWGRLFSPALTGLVILASLVGARSQVLIVDPSHIMVTRPDVRAMAWIREHVPQDALFLVEGFRIYGGRSAVGADAGWWLPLYTHRLNTMPPQYALLNEVPEEEGYSRRVVELVTTLETISPASVEGLRHLCDEGVTHVYVGQGQGEVGAGVTQLFEPEDFLNAGMFRLLYHEDRVHIFAVAAGVCSDLNQ
ncbi:MAG: DUF6541 family protein [Anaerolineae bacterium]